MARTCSVCRHRKRPEIEGALLAGTPLRTIADQFGPSKTALLRHREHLAPALVVAKQAEDVARTDTLIDKAHGLETDARRIGKAAEAAGDARTALAAVRELVRIVELKGHLLGELGNNVAIIVAKLPDEIFEKEWLRRYPGTAPLPREAPGDVDLVEDLRRYFADADREEAAWRANLAPAQAQALADAERAVGFELKRAAAKATSGEECPLATGLLTA